MMPINSTWSLAGQLQASEQWGYKEQLAADATNYPIPFNSFCHVIAFVYKHPSSGSTAHAVVADKTNSGFKFNIGQYATMPYPASDACGWWLAWGIQQWGVTAKSTVTLPVAYTKHCCVDISTNWGYASVKITNLVKLTFVDVQSAQSLSYITVGVQRSGDIPVLHQRMAG